MKVTVVAALILSTCSFAHGLAVSSAMEGGQLTLITRRRANRTGRCRRSARAVRSLPRRSLLRPNGLLRFLLRALGI